MHDHSESIDKAARELRVALETADLAAFGDLLAPNVTWGGPGANPPTCQNKNQVLTWYERRNSSGASATVSELLISGNRVLVGLVVRGMTRAREAGGQIERWQVFTMSEGRIVDIVGFEQKSEAVTWLSTSEDCSN
jgi:ketosteroid isomerase-like protein